MRRSSSAWKSKVAHNENSVHFFKLGFLLSYKSDQNSKLKALSTMLRRITVPVGLKGGMLPVASVAERLLKLGGCAPDCGLARPALGGL